MAKPQIVCVIVKFNVYLRRFEQSNYYLAYY